MAAELTPTRGASRQVSVHPSISVLLPCRNASVTLAEAVSSALADMDPDDELVLVDDGSTDGSDAVAAAIARADRRVRVVRGPGRGIAAALTAGLAACSGAWIARMDADDVTLPGRLAAERALLEGDPTLGVVGTQVEPFGAPAEGMLRYAAWQNALVTPADHARAIFVESPICHPSAMIRRAALDAIGGYREGAFPEDYDLWLRLAAAGWRLAKVPRVLLRWRIHGGNATFTDPRFSLAAFRALRAAHLARRLERPFAVWGAGPAGRRLARELELHGAAPRFFLDIDPRKIGRIARGVAILGVDAGLARARAEGIFLVVAVAARGARDLVRARLVEHGLVEVTDFLCAA
jgi:glycosyltransferase involved in cell wall biosynthesis